MATKLVNADGTDASLGDLIVCADPHTCTLEEVRQYVQDRGLRWEVEFKTITSERFMTQLTDSQRELIAAFLRYSFQDIDFEYDKLTEREKAFGSQEDFVAISKWAREMAGE
jgi:hypothetical protein